MRLASLNEDFLDMLRSLAEEQVDFLVVGAYAMALHGVSRSTGAIDIWIRPSAGNAARGWKALARFGAPMQSLGLREPDLATEGLVLQLGLPPRRIDLLTTIDGAAFADAWATRKTTRLGTLEVPYLDRETLVRSKRASGRAKDLADLALLDEASARGEDG